MPLSKLLTATAATAILSVTAPAAAQSGAPYADYHMHVMSPDAVQLLRADTPKPITAPPEIDRLLKAREAGWNSQAALAPLYADDALVLDGAHQEWSFGHDKVVKGMAELFTRAYRMSPIHVKLDGDLARVGGYYLRGDGASAKPFGSFLLTLRKGPGDQWRIAAEADDFPGPSLLDPIDSDRLVAELDAAGIRKGVVLSVAYWFGSPFSPVKGDEYAKVKAENDWAAAQVARHADRLVFFCSVNPLKDYAVAEVERCSKSLHARGMKIHIGNSDVDMKDAGQAAKVKAVFAAADRQGLPVVVHLWNGPSYGRADAEAFLANILPGAPNVPVTIAHFAGGGPGYTDEALEVFAEAIQNKDPRTKSLYFDVATVADQQKPETLQKFAERIRQVGVKRVLFGHDSGPPAARESWLNFRMTVPLTDAEFAAIAANRMPYLD